MPGRATVGASLEQLLELAIPLLRDAQHQFPRTGPGRKPEFEDWQIAAMILAGVMKMRKSKSSQYRLAAANSKLLGRLLGIGRLPCRSVFFDRYKRCWPLVRQAIVLQGRVALREHVTDATTVAADKSVAAARGPVWHHRDRRRGVVPKGAHGLDREADWGYSQYHDWTWGYGIELVVTAPPKRSGNAAFPLLASVDVASLNEQVAFAAKIPLLPASTRYVALDKGYDSDGVADAIEMHPPRSADGRDAAARVAIASARRATGVSARVSAAGHARPNASGGWHASLSCAAAVAARSTPGANAASSRSTRSSRACSNWTSMSGSGAWTTIARKS